MTSSSNVIAHKVLFEEYSSNEGGGMWCGTNSNVELYNITMFDDNASSASSDLYINQANVSLINSILWNVGTFPIKIMAGDLEVNYSNIQGGYGSIFANWLSTIDWGSENIDVNPLFINPEDGDFNLNYNSPCIDTGHPDTQYNDPDGTRNDMGAFYFNQVQGCMDEIALNFNPDAIINDGNCLYLGDWNFDQEVNIVDIVGIVEFILSGNLANDEQLLIADLDIDGYVTIIDLVWLVDLIVSTP